jgi:phage terminase large subunit-like protein
VEGLDLRDFEGRDVYCGLDLSSKLDLSSLVLAFPTSPPPEKFRQFAGKNEAGFASISGKPSYDIFAWFWLPRNGLGEAERRDSVPYRQWHKAGFLRAPDGDVVDYEDIAQIIKEVDNRFRIKRLAFDPAKMDDLRPKLDDIGLRIDLAEHSQGYRRSRASALWMHESIEQAEAAIQEGRVRVAFNPVLNWNVMSAVVTEDETKNRKFNKRRATARIALS